MNDPVPASPLSVRFEPIVFGAGDIQVPEVRPSWVWQGLLSHGHFSMLTSQWKSGKTTLVSLLLARRRAGSLAGFPLAAGKSLVVSEEDRTLWAMRHQKLHFADDVFFLFRPMAGRPRDAAWPALMEAIRELVAAHGFDSLVIDTLPYFLPPFAEGNSSLLLDALRPLQELAARRLAVLFTHHPVKGEVTLGQAARGTGALPGLVDIQIEMDFFQRADLDDRRRRFHVLSRFADSPRQFVLELLPDGADYRNLGSPLALDFDHFWSILCPLFASAPGPLTRRHILDLWPGSFQAPNPASLCRFLNRAVHQGLLLQDGRGTKNSPFRFALKDKNK